jgi:antirestriction protein ArdC
MENEDRPTYHRDYRQEATNRLIERLELGIAPWQKPWDGSMGMPYNPTSGRKYRGSNVLQLLVASMDRGYEDPRWCSYKQAQNENWQVRRGERGVPIEYFEIKPGEPAKEGEDPAEAVQRRLIHKVYTVFNAEQIHDIPPLERKEREPVEIIQAGEAILKNSGAKIRHHRLDSASYSKRTDTIHLPKREMFKDPAGYYGTALHELLHWSGHESRLDRPTLVNSKGYNPRDEDYAREELAAEIGSFFLALERGIPNNPERHAAYVDSWLNALRRDKHEIFRAAGAASKAADYILALEMAKDVGEEVKEPKADTHAERVQTQRRRAQAGAAR